jgi:magnesium transporter
MDIKDTYCINDNITLEKIAVQILRRGILSYENPITAADKVLDAFETKIFLRRKQPNIIRDSYFLKRKVDVYRRMLLLTRDLIHRFKDESPLNPVIMEDLKDTVDRMYVECDQVRENLNQLLSIHFNVSTQRVNEVILVLTLFSVFFMPLTFIVGVYGMNFKVMPEIDWKYGYLAVWGLMILIVFIIWQWFKRKKWL